MTNQWFRSWHGAPTDHKWLGIARKAGVAPGIVSAIVWALLDRASQATERGSIAGYDADGLACFMGCEAEQVEAIIAAMHEKNVLENNAFSGWDKHQPKREDNSRDRVKAHRERNVTQCNAEKRAETLDTDTDTDTDISAISSLDTPMVSKPKEKIPDRFPEFWAAYPRKVSKGAAVRAFRGAEGKSSPDTIIAACRAFAACCMGKDLEFIPHPSTWLHGERWLDAELATGPPSSTHQGRFVEENSDEWNALKSRGVKLIPLETRIDGRIKRGWWLRQEIA